MKPLTCRALLEKRAEMIQQFRDWFSLLGVLEVEAPVLARASVCDPNIHSLTTQYNGERFYLQTSPEFAMKRLLAEGSGDIFHIGKVFRDDPVGRHHNPEFTMLEWYRLDQGYMQLRTELADFLADLLQLPQFEQISYSQAFKVQMGFDPLQIEDQKLAELCSDVQGELDRDAMLDCLLTRDVLPAYADRGIVLYDYPASQAALAKIRDNVAERFEIIVKGVELANGYSELTDPDIQRQRFNQENQRRVENGKPAVPIDQHFLTALEKGLPECAGVALGLDRLLMLKLEAEFLDQVNPFTLDKI